MGNKTARHLCIRGKLQRYLQLLLLDERNSQIGDAPSVFLRGDELLDDLLISPPRFNQVCPESDLAVCARPPQVRRVKTSDHVPDSFVSRHEYSRDIGTGHPRPNPSGPVRNSTRVPRSAQGVQIEVTHKPLRCAVRLVL